MVELDADGHRADLATAPSAGSSSRPSREPTLASETSSITGTPAASAAWTTPQAVVTS